MVPLGYDATSHCIYSSHIQGSVGGDSSSLASCGMPMEKDVEHVSQRATAVVNCLASMESDDL
jgi:hypothetical protein